MWNFIRGLATSLVAFFIAVLFVHAQAPLQIVTTGLSSGAVGSSYVASVIATGGVQPYTWSVASGSLPPGLALGAGSGVVSGTPTTSGQFSLKVQVQDSSTPPQLATRAFTLRIASIPDGESMGMRVESVTEAGGVITVLTTGAKFVIEQDGTVTFWQRIPTERGVLRVQLPLTPFPLSIVRQGDWAVTVSSTLASLNIRADSVAALKLNGNFTATFQGLIWPSYNVENRGRRLLIDAQGGFGIYPISTSLSSSIDSLWRITYNFPSGAEVWLSVFPPRPYNRQRSFESIAHEGNESAPYPSDAAILSDGIHNKVFALHAYFWAPATINVRSLPTRTATLLGTRPVGAMGTIIDGPVQQYADTVWWRVSYDDGLIGWTIEEFFAPIGRPFRIGDRIQTRAASPWRSTTHVPSNMAEFNRVRDGVHANGMKFVVYISPYYSEAPDIFVEMQHILTDYQVDGFYFDGIADDFWDSHRIIRKARQTLGEDRILYVHDSLWGSYNGLVYFPFVDTYADYILRGEGGRLGLDLQSFLRWTISGYNIGNAVGYWIYYGSNLDTVGDPPGCWRDGTQICYQTDVVPTTAHINAALGNQARIWRTAQAWAGRPVELARFDREYYDGLTFWRAAAQIMVSPNTATVAPGGTQQFTAVAVDSLGTPISPQPTFSWSVSGGGTISSTGLFTAGPTPGGPYVVTATAYGMNGTSSVIVQ